MRLAPFAIVLFVAGSSAGSTALPNCLRELDQRIALVGVPEAGEVSTELRELQALVTELRDDARRVIDEERALQEERQSLERARREREDRLRQIENGIRLENMRKEDLERRGAIHDREAAQQRAEYLAARTPEARASAAAWGGRINARRALLERERVELNARGYDLMRQRDAILQGDVITEASNFRWMTQRAQHVDQAMDRTIQQCAALSQRALALRQIANMPSRHRVEYRPPDAIAEAVGENLAEAIAEEAAAGLMRNVPAMRRVLVALRRSAGYAWRSRGSVAVLAADIGTDAWLAGMRQEEREVVRNIYLVGDYARAMEIMIEANRQGATSSEEYLAVRAELERLHGEMPGSPAEFMLESAQNPGLLTGAFASMATNYVSGGAERFVGRVSASTSEGRRLLGPGFTRGFRDLNQAYARMWTESVTAAAAEPVAESAADNVENTLTSY